MKKYIKLLIIPLLLVGCSENFLEQTKTDALSESTLFHSEADGLAAVNGVYNQLHQNHIDFIIKGIWYNANFLTQDVNNWGADVFYKTYDIPATFSSLDKLWGNCYVGISRANSVIPSLKTLITNGFISEALGNRLIGECKFLRGFYYTILASNFGGVPLLLAPSYTGKEPRSSQDEVFVAVANDMQDAADVLPWSYDNLNVGRATKGAALAYLGEAFLWIKEYARAETALQQVRDYSIANPTVIGLQEKYWDIHDIAFENGKEALFSVQYHTPEARDWNTPNDAQWLQNFTMPDEINNTGYAFCDKLYYDAFESGDTRKIASVIGPGDQHPTCPINSYPKITDGINIKSDSVDYNINTCGTVTHPWNRADRSGYYVMKFWRQPESIIDNYKSRHFSELNLIMMRYGQVLLDLADAKANLNKELEARDLVQEIRNRAWQGTAPVSTGNITDVLVKEFRLEVAGEFSLWYILRRMGQARNFIEKYHPGTTIPNGRELLPIPQNQMDLNPNLIQNQY